MNPNMHLRPLLFSVLAAMLAVPLTAQKPRAGSSGSRPAPRVSTPAPRASTPAPRPAPRVSTPAPRVSAPAPRASQPAPRPTYTPPPATRSRPTYTPPSRPTYTPPRATPTRPTYTPPSRPTYTPPSRPTYTPPSTRSAPTVGSRPGYVPTPRVTPQPGGGSRSQPVTPRPVGGRPVYDRGDSSNGGNLPRPVGGSVRGIGSDRRAPSGSVSGLRDLYDRTQPRPGATKVDGRRVTSGTIADRYAPKPNDARRNMPDKTSPRSGVAPSATARPRPTTVAPIADRYAPSPRPRSSQPTVQPRHTGIIGGAVGPRRTPGAAAPRLNPRGGATVPGTRSHFRGGANRYPDWCSWTGRHSSLWVSSHSWCWNWGGPWWWSSCSPSYWYWSTGWYGSWSNNWCRPRHHIYTCWWWPTSCYYPTYYYGYDQGYDYVPSYLYQPSYVSVIDPTPAAPAPRSVELTPAQLAEKYVALGDFYFSEGRFSEAADAYARARTYAPDDPSILFTLSDAAFATGDYHFAAYLIGEALRMEPGMAYADTDKRLLYKDVKVFELQMQTLRKYIAEKPYDAMAELVLGYNLKFSGKADEANKAFARVLEIDPESSAAKAFLDAMTKPAPAPEKADH